MGRKSEKPALIEKCDELGIEYKSSDSIDELKKKIAEAVAEPAETAEPTSEEAPVDSVEPSEEVPTEPVEPKPSKFIEGKFVENAPVISATLIDGYMIVKTTVATYKLSEAEYNAI